MVTFKYVDDYTKGMETLESVLKDSSCNGQKNNSAYNGIRPFGVQYMEQPKVDRPGEPKNWSWIPVVEVKLTDEAESWPGTTGTGPSAKEDEVYGESG